MNRSAPLPPVRAILGPTNTGKTHLAIERMCGHSSGMIGFPLRLLAREVYDKVRAIKGDALTALITGEERIEPPGARYFLCTAEAMPKAIPGRQPGAGEARAFVALDEAQLAADPERGHIFTDHLLGTRGREETMLLGSATLAPLVRALVPGASIEERPRFSTLSHAGAVKLSRLPPRSAIVAFSAAQVYQVAELLRRFRGGAAVVMGALSPQTRNRQVELFQSGEVDYIVATDAIGMGLNLDVHHVAFAALAKFDGSRHRRLTPAELAQIAGRAGRHHRDGTFGTLSGIGTGETRGPPVLTEEEIHAIEHHAFAPLTRLFWREPHPRMDSIETLLSDLEAPPGRTELAPAPEAIDLAVLRRLAEDGELPAGLAGPADVRRLWQACQLPDFRQQGAEMHARFVARLWRDLRSGHLAADFVAARISELDRAGGDIESLQGRLAAIRSWAYICQRPDWVLAREEMAARARGVEARLSDALHQKLTERFVNRRTWVLMKGMGKDAGLLRVELDDDGKVSVEGHAIGHLEGFRFVVDPDAGQEDRKLMLAAAQRHLPDLLARRAARLIEQELGTLTLRAQQIWCADQAIARLERGRASARPRLVMAADLGALDPARKAQLAEALEHWLERTLAPLAPLRLIEEAAGAPDLGSEVRALLVALAARGGLVVREEAGLAHIPKEKRPELRRLGVSIGALDVFVPALLKPAARRLMHELGLDPRPLDPGMAPVIEGPGDASGPLPAGYRRAGCQAIRVDMAEKLVRAAHDQRARAQGEGHGFSIDAALATSMGLVAENFRALMKDAGFRAGEATSLPEGVFGPPAPVPWSWRPPRQGARGAFASRRPGRGDSRAGDSRAGDAGSRGPRAGRSGPGRGRDGQDRAGQAGAQLAQANADRPRPDLPRRDRAGGAKAAGANTGQANTGQASTGQAHAGQEQAAPGQRRPRPAPGAAQPQRRPDPAHSPFAALADLFN